MFTLKDKVAIVTGGGRGLGSAISIALARAGASIFIATKDIDKSLEDTIEKIHLLDRSAHYIEVDVSNPITTEEMARVTYEKFKRIDILVNNAALYFGLHRRAFNEIPHEEWDKIMAVNVKGTWLCTRAVFPYMKSQQKGKVINIASEVFFTGSHGFPHYVASKGAVIGLTRALAAELGAFNICVNAVAPGFLDTEASRSIADVQKYDTARTPLKRLGMPEDVVGAVLFLASDASDFITGQTIVVDGGRYMH